ncbi:hypothetical protein TIFTF001_007941 [Ficus carica]|uniref:Uncharacterized protein n=1 Tax=Ficus carica TaxID=3494 RepID=A0AA88A7L8_FICCA|nr:hypothetical protein TIFTF001_007941 [Ficus carica]
MEANEAKKGIPNNIKISNNNNNNGQNGKKVQPNQNMGMKLAPSAGGVAGAHPNGLIDQKTLAALKLASNNHNPNFNQNQNQAQFGNGQMRNTMMNLAGAGFHGNHVQNNNPNGLGDGVQFHHQQQPNSGFPSSASPNLPPTSSLMNMNMNMNGLNNPNHQANMANLMNMQARQAMMQQQQQQLHHQQQQQQQQQQLHQQQQPQVMYQRSPFVPPNTGYYYNYNPCYPPPYSSVPQPYPEPNYGSESSAAHMFSDENTNGCSIM